MSTEHLSNQPEQNPDVPSTGNEAKKRTRIVFSGITPEGARRLETHFRNLRELGIPWMMEGHEVLEIGAVFDHDHSDLE